MRELFHPKVLTIHKSQAFDVIDARRFSLRNDVNALAIVSLVYKRRSGRRRRFI